MKQALIDALKSFGYPVMLQGSLTKDDPYPESFFTVWNSETDDGSHYDNKAVSYVWQFTVYFYSIDPTLVNTILLAAKDLLKQSKWIVGGKGYDVPSDEPSHTGRALDVFYLEKEE